MLKRVQNRFKSVLKLFVKTGVTVTFLADLFKTLE
ncbi:hypothetical protein predicted by Glimmer/Critica [Bdellovibrio bacteriovorus HD100]|uniref:Uncharacterized protein n=1 Tax=Bdellovibrio bacteriovorus (strain ATCC 15356 / DSM 50701 / NCIMB 9529 / HD100) TaxID=264462 RepID=Q6MLN3_BDEBA|nr:hypothetical protein predicted by Glimmer/Critica [Bdellovibrio bacteriovorus HD100]